ncbi:MAG: DUF5103 domain-containing protein [Bacteroidales bacterium]|nr:DUF5103 domain-containing protein [Bacteroidales bacterium]
MNTRYFRIVNLFLFFLFCGFVTTYAQTPFRTGINDSKIKTLRVRMAGDLLSDPIIELNSQNFIDISFDELVPEMTRFSYRIIHCNADWTPSPLSPIEYMFGPQDLPVDNYEFSRGTTVDYCHYQLYLPNQDVEFKVSGNYAVQIYRDDNPDIPVITACVYVVETQVGVSMEITSRTEVDFNKEHQQVNFIIDHPDITINYPQSDLKLYLYQNNRFDNAVTNIQPYHIDRKRIEYRHNRDLIFQAGNEFRRFEFTSIRMPGMNVEELSYFSPFYHINLFPDKVRKTATYSYDQDQNGRFYIHTNDGDENDLDADYEIVHFTLPMEEPFLNGNVYMCGEMYQYQLDEKSKVGYNFDTKAYEKSILLKQGSYNYQYLFVPKGKTKGETFPIEGDKYETENEYRLMIYYHPMGEKYDHLIGVHRALMH